MFAKALSKFFHLKAFPKGPIPKAGLNKMKVTGSVSFPTIS